MVVRRLDAVADEEAKELLHEDVRSGLLFEADADNVLGLPDALLAEDALDAVAARRRRYVMMNATVFMMTSMAVTFRPAWTTKSTSRLWSRQ